MRWLYFPMVFLGPLGCLAIKQLTRAGKSLTVIGLSMVLFYFGGYSFVLNHELWKDEESLFTNEINEFCNSYYAYGYALKHLEQENFEKAERYFEIAIDGFHHKKAAAYLKYAALLSRQGRFEEVIALLEKNEMLPEKRQERGQWYSHLGTAYFELGKKRKALEYSQKAVSCCPTNSLFLANLGGAYGSIRAYSKSIDVLEKALNLRPESVAIRKSLAQTYIRLGKYKEAMDILKQIDPEILKTDKKFMFFYYKAKENLEN
jgi:tetratricopeptide (TPR) repeat protein